MSALITTNITISGGPGLNDANKNDDRLQNPDYRLTDLSTGFGRLQDVDFLWSRSHLIEPGGGIPMDYISQIWEPLGPPQGVHVRKSVSGIVRDANGNPVSGATVQLFNTATGLLVDTQTSAVDGSYACGDPNAVNCFVVAYLAGSPDTTGLTVNTVTGS